MSATTDDRPVAIHESVPPLDDSPATTPTDRSDDYSTDDDGDDEVLVPRLGHISSRRRTPSPPFGHRSAKTSDKTPKGSQTVIVASSEAGNPISPLALETAVKVEAGDSVPVKSNVFFSPLSPEFTPKWTQPAPPPPSKTPNLIEFPSPESGSSRGTPTEEMTEEEKDRQWAIGPDGQLVDHTGGQWDLAPEIMRLQQEQANGGSTPVLTPTKPRSSSLLPTARPWSPSPLRNEQRPDSDGTAVPDMTTREEMNRKRYCAGELGEPDDSFPFTAFSTWRQKKLISDLPSPPIGFGPTHRRNRSGSGDSASSAGSIISSYLSGGIGGSNSGLSGLRYGAGSPSNVGTVNGTPPPMFDSPRAAFAQFEAVHSRRSSLGSGGSDGTSGRGMVGGNGLPFNGGGAAAPFANNGGLPFGRATEVGTAIPRFDQVHPLAAMQQQQQQQQRSMMPSQALALDNPLAALYQIANQAAINPELGQAVMRLAGLSVGNGPVNPMGPSPHNRKLGLYKTELCRSWEEKGSCRYGAKCQFAHGHEELRSVSRHPKTELCRAYANTGSCPYGKRCCFRHEGSAMDMSSGFPPARMPALPGAGPLAFNGRASNGTFGSAVNGYLGGGSSSSSSTSSLDELRHPQAAQPPSPTFYDGVLAHQQGRQPGFGSPSRNSSESSFGLHSPRSSLVGPFSPNGSGQSFDMRADEFGRLPGTSGAMHGGGSFGSGPASSGSLSRVDRLRSTAAQPLPPPSLAGSNGSSLLSSLSEDSVSVPTSSSAIWQPAASTRISVTHPSAGGAVNFAPFDAAFPPLASSSTTPTASAFDRAPGSRPGRSS